MFIQLVHSVSLILSLALFYGLVLRIWPYRTPVSTVVAGCLFGGICMLAMTFPVTLVPGVIFDARSIILPLAAIFSGPLAGVIAGTIAAGYRLWLGGGGVYVGISVCVIAVAASLIYRHLLLADRIRVNFWSLFALGGFVHIAEVILFTFLPDPVSDRVLSTIALPVIIIFVPATAFLGLVFQAIEEQVVTKEELLQVRTEKAKSLEELIDVLSTALASRDPYIAGHAMHVADISDKIGKKLSYDTHRLEGLHLAAAVHDFGNIRVPTDILVKPSKLLDEEFNLIKSHAEAGAELLKDIEFDWPIQEIIRQHHERMDGSGYPRGLKGEQIVEEARILAVADTVAAMTAHRPHRPALDMETVKQELTTGRGKQYDAKIVDACLHLIEQGEI